VLLIVVVVPFVVICADAVIYVAPLEVLLVALKVTEAVPLTSVNAVVGVRTASVVSDAAKVTTAPFTSVPVVSLSIAVTVTGGVPYVTLDGTLKVRELRSVVVVPVPVPVLLSTLPPHPLRQKNRAKKISSSAGRENLAVIDFTIFTLLFPRER
jgi:hypothetical protein